MLCKCDIKTEKGQPMTFRDAFEDAIRCNRVFEIRLQGETESSKFGVICVSVNREDQTLNFGFKSRISIELKHISDLYSCNNEWEVETNKGPANIKIVPSELENMLFHQHKNPKLRIGDDIINQNDYCLHDGIVNCYIDSVLKIQFGLSKVLCNEGSKYYVENTNEKRMFVTILSNYQG